MQYKVTWCEQKTSQTGKTYTSAKLQDEQGATFDVSIWPDYSHYTEIVNGGILEGVIQTKGKYSNLVDGNLGKPPWRGGFKDNAISKAQDIKREDIHKAQQSKEESIKISSSSRDATLIVTTLYPELSTFEGTMKDEAIKEKWLEWRAWLLGEFDNTPPF